MQVVCMSALFRRHGQCEGLGHVSAIPLSLLPTDIILLSSEHSFCFSDEALGVVVLDWALGTLCVWLIWLI